MRGCMASDISLSPVRIHDAQRIRAAGISSLKIPEISSWLRETISDPAKAMFIAVKADDPDQAVIAYIGLSAIHPVHQNAVLQCWFSPQLTAGSEEIQEKVVSSALRVAFFTLRLHRVSWIIPVTDIRSEKVALACGMRQEAVMEEAYCESDCFVDAGLFSLLSTEYPDYAVAFVPFVRGVLAIRGSSEAVEGIRFHEYGEILVDLFEKRAAVRVGLSDQSGRLLPQGADTYGHIVQQLPEELGKAVRELKEYFAKSRTSFSIRVNFPSGSDFQRHVWQELQKIPYGATVSYEDIALALTGNDKVAARNLSRAVGSACSDNPVPILVPCHRVIGKDGRLVGFSGGIEVKEFLLDHEIFGFFRTVQDKAAVT